MATDAVARMRCRIGEHELEVEGPTAFVAEQVDRWARLAGLATAPPTPPREPRDSVLLSGVATELGTPAKPADLFHFDQGKRLVVPRLLRRGRRPSAEAALLILYGYRIFVPEKP